MIGVFEGFEVTLGSFGQQNTTINGVKYVTWFNLADPRLKGLEAGARVEFEPRPGPTVLCHSPHVECGMPSARILGVVKTTSEAA